MPKPKTPDEIRTMTPTELLTHFRGGRPPEYPRPASLSSRLRAISLDMKEQGVNMIRTGHPEVALHGQELINAAETADTWVREIEALEPF